MIDPSRAEEGPAPNIISLRDVDKSIGQGLSRVYLLRNINIDVADGDFISIMGPSGAGKSTLLHLLGMYDMSWGGEYHLMGQPVHRLDKKARSELNKKYIGFVFQSYHLLDSLTVYENLEIPLSYRNVRQAERKSIVCEALDRFHIVGKKDLFPNQLSGGQQQLIGVARAMIAKPKLILADEPTGNLHSNQSKEIMELFKKLNSEGVTIIQLTHSEKNAEYGNRIINIEDGLISRPL